MPAKAADPATLVGQLYRPCCYQQGKNSQWTESGQNIGKNLRFQLTSSLSSRISRWLYMVFRPNIYCSMEHLFDVYLGTTRTTLSNGAKCVSRRTRDS